MVQFAFAYRLCSLESERHKWADFGFWALTAFELFIPPLSTFWPSQQSFSFSQCCLPNTLSSPPQLAVSENMMCIATLWVTVTSCVAALGSVWLHVGHSSSPDLGCGIAWHMPSEQEWQGCAGSCWTGPFILKPTNGIFWSFLLSSRYFHVMLSEVGYWEAFNVCLLSTRWCSSSPVDQATLE